MVLWYITGGSALEAIAHTFSLALTKPVLAAQVAESIFMSIYWWFGLCKFCSRSQYGVDAIVTTVGISLVVLSSSCEISTAPHSLDENYRFHQKGWIFVSTPLPGWDSLCRLRDAMHPAAALASISVSICRFDAFVPPSRFH
jgi:hypothetical protein